MPLNKETKPNQTNDGELMKPVLSARLDDDDDDDDDEFYLWGK